MWMYFKDCPILPKYKINEIAEIEPLARDGVCLIPEKAVDLMIHARKGKYQSTQERKDIRIKNVPGVLAEALAEELHSHIRITDIHFARKKHKKHWHILETQRPGLVNVVLKFAPSTALKNLVVDAGIVDRTKVKKYTDIAPDNTLYPVELGYAPFAKAISCGPYWQAKYKIGRKSKRTGVTWPALVEQHIHWWRTHAEARQYAADDVKYTRSLYDYLGRPEETNDDILASYVAATRWKGFAIDSEGVQKAKDAAVKRITTRIDPNSVKTRLLSTLNPIERAVLVAQNKTGISTNKVVLEKLAAMGNAYAQEVIDSRKALKEIELYDKLIIAGRLHASLKVSGTLSNRMAGADGLNVQAINNLQRVRSLFPMANFSVRTECPGCKICMSKAKKNELGEIMEPPKQSFQHGKFEFTEHNSQGDFESFEVVIAECVYNDPNLRRDLLTCESCGGEMQPFKLSFRCGTCGGYDAKKIHGLMGMALYPGQTYEQVKESKGKTFDMYTNGKRGVFALLYGGTAFTIATKIGIPIAVAEQALADFIKKYLQVGIERSRVASRFTALRQSGGLGTRISYSEPADYVENIYGFKRHFTLENLVIKRIYELSTNLPPSLVMAGKKFKIVRNLDTGREQTGDGAVRTALYAAAFAQQQANIRAAQNTVIQSSGAESCKDLQVQIVTIQPRGIHPWKVRAVQVHDSISAVSASEVEVKEISNRVQTFVDRLRERVPLLGIDWIEHATSWAE